MAYSKNYWDAQAEEAWYWWKQTGDDYWLAQYRRATLNAATADDTTSGGGDGSSDTYSVSIHYNNSKKTFSGTSGKDSIINYGDYITLYAGAGNDIVVNAGIGYDVIYGDTGNDSIKNVAYFSTIFGGAGNDTILSFEDDTSVFVYNSGDGNDVIQGFASSDTLSISGASYSTKKSGSDIIVTVGEGKISLIGAANLSTVNIKGTKGSGGSTKLTVTNSTKSPVTVGSAIKTIDASSRTKAVKITGNKLANTITGGSGKDSIYGGAGNDSILGGKGNDKLYGQAGNDILKGGAGNDSLWGGKGNDSLWGDSGKDTFIYAKGDGKDVIYGFDNSDMLKITGTFSASYNESKEEIYFKVGSTASAITLKDFSATTFNINGTNYKISGSKLVKK